MKLSSSIALVALMMAMDAAALPQPYDVMAHKQDDDPHGTSMFLHHMLNAEGRAMHQMHPDSSLQPTTRSTLVHPSMVMEPDTVSGTAASGGANMMAHPYGHSHTPSDEGMLAVSPYTARPSYLIHNASVPSATIHTVHLHPMHAMADNATASSMNGTSHIHTGTLTEGHHFDNSTLAANATASSNTTALDSHPVSSNSTHDAHASHNGTAAVGTLLPLNGTAISNSTTSMPLSPSPASPAIDAGNPTKKADDGVLDKKVHDHAAAAAAAAASANSTATPSLTAPTTGTSASNSTSNNDAKMPAEADSKESATKAPVPGPDSNTKPDDAQHNAAAQSLTTGWKTIAPLGLSLVASSAMAFVIL